MASGPEPYSREWHEAHIDALVQQLAEAMGAWLSRDREDWRSSNRAAGRLELLMRSISGEAAAIKSIDAHDRWWGVRAIRE